MKTLTDIYNECTPGSQGFCIAVETHCGFNTSRSETARIAERAETAEEFQRIWQDEDSWTDENNQNADAA